MKNKICSPEKRSVIPESAIASGVRTSQDRSPTVEQMKTELLTAGWVPEKHTAWRAPITRQLYIGPYGAWRVMCAMADFALANYPPRKDRRS